MANGPLAPYEFPAGWYKDPHGRDFLRWWDGERWTEGTKPIARQAAPVRTPQAPGNRQGDWETGSSGQARLRHEPPQFRQAEPPPFTHANDSVTRIDESFTRTNDTYRNEGRGEHWRAAPEVGYSATPRKAAVAEVPPAADPAAEEMRRIGLDRLALSALFGFSLVLFAAGFVLDNDVLRLVALTGALIFGVGTAPLQLSERASLSLRLGVGVLIALSVPTVVGSVMVLVPLWHPVLVAVVVGAAAVWVHAVACRRVLSGPLGIPRPAPPRLGNFLNASVACTLIGTLLWVIGMVATGHVVPGLWGFLPKAPVYWYLGLGLVVIGVVLAYGEHELPAAFGTVSLLAALTLTPSVVYGWPRQPAGVKHVDLVQTILQVHYLNRGAGIYQAYSGFFSAVAWLCDIARMPNIMGIATYWPFFIDLLGVVALRCFLGQMTASIYRIWLAITMVILADTVGQDYFSPQSVGFVLGIGVFWLMLDRGGFPGLNERSRIYLIALASCAMAVTHELTPYIVGGVLVILVVFKIGRPRYIPIVVLAPAIIWALLNKDDLGSFISLQDFGDLTNFSPPKVGTVFPLQRLPVVGEGSDALMFGFGVFIVIAFIGLLRNIRSRAAWAFMISTGVALILIAAEPYGNEGIFRAALFGLPWLAAVGTQVLPRRRSQWASAIFGVIAVGLVGTYLIAEFGLDNFDVVRPADYQAMLTYQAQASPNSYLFLLEDAGDILPHSVDKPLEKSHWVAWNTLLTVAQQENIHPTVQDAGVLAQEYYQFAQTNDGETSELYAIWTPAAANYAVDYGLESLTQSDNWRNVILASPDWKLVYSSDGTYLLRVAPDVRAPKNQKNP
jgi:hypothetical protein